MWIWPWQTNRSRRDVRSDAYRPCGARARLQIFGLQAKNTLFIASHEIQDQVYEILKMVTRVTFDIFQLHSW